MSKFGSDNYSESDISEKQGSRIATYVYRDEFGRDVIENDRYENLMDGKWFIPRWLNQEKPQDRHGDPAWWFKRDYPHGTPPMVLYRLPELRTAEEDAVVYLCEGEKDTDNVAALGLVATTNICGATTWEKSYNNWLRNRHVVILEDNDPKGAERSKMLKAELTGVVASIKVIQFPGLPPKGDVSDWLAQGKSREDFLNYVETFKPRQRFNFAWADTLNPNAAKKRWLIKGVLGEGEFTLFSGLPGCGKSVALTDAACHVAAGVDWHGKAIQQGLVIYFAAERKSLTERRVLAWREEHNIKDDMPLALVNGPLALSEKPEDEAQALIDAIKDAEAIAGLPCVWIILDTLTRTYGGGDQNASKDMGRYIKAVDALTHGTGAHVSVIHHTTWDGQRGKGAIDLDGAVDASFLIKKTGDAYCLACDGANDMDEGPVLHYKLAAREYGVDEETGEPLNAPVVIAIEAPIEVDALLRGQAGDVLAALKAAITAKPNKTYVDLGQSPLSERVGASIEDWRSNYRALFGADRKADTVDRTFRRQKDKLETAKLVTIIGTYAYIIEQEEALPF